MSTTMSLTGKTALITGATAGIGEAAAVRLAAAGAAIVAVGRDHGRGEALVAQIAAAGGAARFISADVGEPADVQRVLDHAGPVDVLVNNAGFATFGPSEALTVEHFDRMFSVNVRGAFFLVAGIAPGMAERGGGSIINISSAAAAVGSAGISAYGATKSALESLTRAWTAEYSGRGVRINSVAPGPTYTAAGPREMFEQVAAATAMLRAAEPAEVAEMIFFLASDMSSYSTGGTFAIDGGRSAI